MTRDKLIIANMIRLADHHRETCEGATCNIMLSLILELFNRANIKLSAEEMKHFA